MNDIIRDFVRNAHGNLERVKEIYAEHPDIIDEAFEWSPGQTETALQAAAHTGQRAIAEFLLDNGATPNMVVYAMLGDEAKFDAMLADNPDNIHEIGAHNFSLMFHAAFGGHQAIIEKIYDKLDDPDLGTPLLAALMANQNDAARWFVERGAPLDKSDFRGRTALEMVVEADNDEMIAYLQDKIGADNLEVCDNCGEQGYKYLAEVEGNPMGAHTKYFHCKKCGHEMEVRAVG